MSAAGRRLLSGADVALVDLRETAERERHGVIPGSLHAPFRTCRRIRPGGLLYELAHDRQAVVFFCAFGERTAMAVQAAQDAGLSSACHIEGGMSAWTKAGGATR